MAAIQRDAAAIDPWGRVVAKVVDRRGRRSNLIADLPLGTHGSLFVRLGDWVGWVCLSGLLLFLVAARWKPRVAFS